MIRSMTGFGRAEAERDGRSLIAEVRSVNHRFLEFSIRLPRGVQSLESKLRARLSEQADRGKFNLTVSWKGATENGGEANLNMDLAQRYYTLLQDMRAQFDFREPITLPQLLQLPDVIAWTEPDLDADAAWDHLTAAVDPAMRDLFSMREAEGAALAKDLLARLKTLQKGLKAVESRAPERAKETRDRLHTRITELLAGEAEVDKDRVLIEAAIQAERMDCTEETVRLASHIDQFGSLLKAGGPVGRKLNFLTQEMNREANTIGSKAYDSAIAHEVIGLKEEIEILREQIQNLE